MTNSAGLRTKIKRGSSPLIEGDENVPVVSRSPHHKMAKFKSPLSIACPTVSDDCLLPSCEGNPDDRSTSLRKRAFGTDSSNLQPSVESANRTQKKVKICYEEQSHVMPGFSSILEDIYQICEADVKIEPDDKLHEEKNAESQPSFQTTEAGNAATLRSKLSGYTGGRNSNKEGDNAEAEAGSAATPTSMPSGVTVERNFDKEGDEATVDLEEEIERPRANFGRRIAATNRSSLFSKFKVPGRVGSVCKAQEASHLTSSLPCTAARPQLFRSPYKSSATPITTANANDSLSTTEKIASDYYCVMYCIRKPNTKSKGPWSDGVLIRRGRSFVLQDTDGKVVLKDGEQSSGALMEGATLLMGKFEVEVMSISTEEAFRSKKILQGTVDVPSGAIAKVVPRRHFKSFQPPQAKLPRVPILTNNITPREVSTPKVKPTLGQDALVLNAKDRRGDFNPVIVDQYVASKLRPHQREGVKFMYECVMGLRNPSFTGCLLADAMGLGKTLQVIALIWTLIKQGPRGHAAVKRVLVVCPSSLVENWGKEVRKWLGNERLPPLIIHSGTPAKDVKRKISSFQVGSVYHLLITSYELLRKHKDDLSAAKPGLLVCDEAHRLKNCAGNKTIDSLLTLKSPMRLILTGTPIQNDLMEFYAMIDFVNPNLLGSLSTFKRLFANPIEKSRDRDASENEKMLGLERSAELQSLTRFCILQRAANVNAKYLPSKTEYVVFCKLQASQVCLYQNFLKSKLVSESLASGQSAFVLSAIGTLRKLCNHPMLVQHELSHDGNRNVSGVSSKRGDALKQPNRRQDRTSADWRLSGKLSCLHRLLLAVHSSATAGGRDKVVVVSNFTQTLDIIQVMCDGQGWRWLRLDGATNVSERQAMVDRFNAIGSDHTVFLLSSKAGGSGLNLIGANRLVLFDPDWNPATDAQAMARVWRDGQKKSVFIYRLLTTASIEEKIYQRQIMKGEVAAAVEEQVEGEGLGSDGGGRRHFSGEELRELFTLNMETSCDTYDLLSQSESSSSESWRDYSNEVEDHALKEAILTGLVTFVYQKTYVKDIFPSVDSIQNRENPKLDEQRAVDANQQWSSNSVSDVLDGEMAEMQPPRQPKNAVDDWEAIERNASPAAPDVVDDRGEPKPECKDPIAIPIRRERKLRLRSKDEFLSENCPSVSPEVTRTVNGMNTSSSITEQIFCDEFDDDGYERLRATNSGPAFEDDGNALQDANDEKHAVLCDEVNEKLDDCEVQAASKDEWEHANSIRLQYGQLREDSASRLVSEVEPNTEDTRDCSPDTNLVDESSAAVHIGEEVFKCLQGSRSQKILELMEKLPVPDDEFSEDQLEDLDAPFICSLDLEIEMKRASFAPVDLWEGFKDFAIGFLLEENDQKETYRMSKLGLVLDKCNLDKVADDESVFSKGFPMVRAVLSKRESLRAADLSQLYASLEREDNLQTTSTGRFITALMRQFDKMQTERDEKA